MFRKYQKVEQSALVSKQGHVVIEDELRKTGKKSVKELSDDERATFSDRLEDVENP